MKIIELVHEFPKLSETFILNHIVELCRRGHEIKIISFSNPKEEKIHENVLKYNLLNKTLQIIDFPNGRKKLNAFLGAVIAGFYKMPAFTAKRLIESFSFLPNIFRCADLFLLANFHLFGKDGEKVVIIHFPDEKTLRKINGEKPKCPYVLVFYASPDLYRKEARKILINYKEAVEKAGAIITISKYNKEFLRNNIGINSKIEIIHDSISDDYLSFKPKIMEVNHRIISVCRFVEQKGIRYLIEACALLKKKGIKFEVVLVGEGEEEKLYWGLIEKYSLKNEVKFLGSLTQKDTIKEISKSAVFVLPCVIAKDGRRDILPNVLKEAMALEKPVITSDICGIEELVENGKSGILVPEKNPAELANAIEKLLKNPGLSRKMGKEGRKRVEKSFNIGIETEKLERILKGVVTIK